MHGSAQVSRLPLNNPYRIRIFRLPDLANAAMRGWLTQFGTTADRVWNRKQRRTDCRSRRWACLEGRCE